MLTKYKLLLPSLIAMFIIIAVGTVVTITYAWSSSNRNVGGDTESVNVNLPIVVLASDSYNPDANQSTFEYGLLEDNGFGTTISFSPTNVLYPSSTVDGVNFRYATNVNTSGQAITATGDIDTYEAIDEMYARYFYLEKTFYLVNAYTEEVVVYLSNVDFVEGTEGTNLNKAVRLCVICGNNTKIIRDADGTAYPANGPETVASTDPAVSESSIGRNTFNITLPAMSKNPDNGKYYCTPVLVTLRVWIEGQSPYAVVAYSGHAFRVNVDFDVK